MLNALRHQWNHHIRRRHDPRRGHRCSTPCGINGIITDVAELDFLVDTVLNALRHQWNHHNGPNFVCGHHIVCSTPCGINGIITPARRRYRRVQQLCSTPCGINGIITHHADWHGDATSVLNALRHQWNHHMVIAAEGACTHACSTPCGINGIITNAVTRMLAAMGECSTPCGINGIITLKRGGWSPLAMRAQRLAASMESSHGDYGYAGLVCRRAQRLAASMESSPLDVLGDYFAVLCSTPCGINGIITRLEERRQEIQAKCSTPCGINGIITLSHLVCR